MIKRLIVAMTMAMVLVWCGSAMAQDRCFTFNGTVTNFANNMNAVDPRIIITTFS